MRRLPYTRQRGSRERGGVLVIFALFAPVAILFASLVIDLGNAWWHQQHLQVQADAAALAAAQQFQPCDDAKITAAAGQYGGLAGNPLYNPQIGGTSTSNVHQVINSQTFYGQSDPVDATVNTSNPCAAMMADIKMTEANLPFYLRIPNELMTGFANINAQARVEIRQMTMAGAGELPVAVNDASFKSAEAFFINESPGANNAVLGSEPLTRAGTSNGLSMWIGASAFSLTVPSVSGTDVAVRVALSGTNNLTGNMATDCSKAGVFCLDSSSGTAPLLDVHGWSSAGRGTPSAPSLGQVFLTLGSCGDPYYTSSYYTGAATTCNDGVQANIDFGGSPNLKSITVSANGNKLSCTSAQPAVCTGTVPVTATSGRAAVAITVKQGKNTLLSAPNAQSTYAAAVNGNAGPIQTLSLFDTGTQTSDVSSLQQGTTHQLVVNMGISGDLAVAQSVSDPVYTMRFDGTGSQNGSVNCTAVNGGSTFADMLASGCAGQFQINQSEACPDSSNPVDCVSPATGNKTNQVAKGINQRVLGAQKPSVCTAPNHWASYPNIAANDPRVVTVFITPYGSFGGSGASQQFPIQEFAAFYITGWQDQGNGFNNPCQGNGDDPAQPGTIVGHFISYVNTATSKGGGGTACVPNSLDECVAELTR